MKGGAALGLEPPTVFLLFLVFLFEVLVVVVVVVLVVVVVVLGKISTTRAGIHP